MGHRSLAAHRTRIARGHRGVHTALVEEDESIEVECFEFFDERLLALDDVVTEALCGQLGLFLSVTPARINARCIVDGATFLPNSLSHAAQMVTVHPLDRMTDPPKAAGVI
jgi:hypothetical protein